jgi:hypothetical protein
MHNTAAIVTAMDWNPARVGPFPDILNFAALPERGSLIGLELARFADSPSQSIHP